MQFLRKEVSLRDTKPERQKREERKRQTDTGPSCPDLEAPALEKENESMSSNITDQIQMTPGYLDRGALLFSAIDFD